MFDGRRQTLTPLILLAHPKPLPFADKSTSGQDEEVKGHWMKTDIR